MSALLRALMAQQGSGDVPNLAIDTDVITQFDHLTGRMGTQVTGKTLMKRDATYRLTCDVEINITEVNIAEYNALLLGGYGQWHNASALGRFGDVDNVGVFNKKIDHTGRYYSSNPDSWCRIDCGGLKGFIRFYNIRITEV